MPDTDTKQHLPVARPVPRRVLRVCFCVDAALVPPPIVRPSAAGSLIGRGSECGLQLSDPRVSSRHALVRQLRVDDIRLEDLNSKNGTFVNGQRVEQASLALGDVISLGDSCLVLGEEPGEAGGDAHYGLLGDSAAVREIRRKVQLLGPSTLNVLLVAESGSGKELVARALHAASGCRGELVAVNCAAVPENLFESQFFGHKAGAFTGAAAQQGYFRAAAEGTLFLDEIGELPLSQQPKLLRAIEERAITPLGTTRALPCPVRIVAATNRDLPGAVERGQFRADLFARLHETSITLPPLRARREDILEVFGSALGPDARLSHGLVEALLLHSWPLNVRELLAVAREAHLHRTPGASLGLEHLRALLAPAREVPGESSLARGVEARDQNKGAATLPPSEPSGPPDALALRTLLATHGGNVAEVARAVGRSRRQLYRLIQKYELEIEDFRK